jgi:hypothetical protein
VFVGETAVEALGAGLLLVLAVGVEVPGAMGFATVVFAEENAPPVET